MHDRRTEYARCTRALVDDRERDGASGIFDTAVTNGLAEIVAARWPGEEATAQGWMKAANALLDVVVANGAPNAEGFYEFPDLEPPPPEGNVFGPPLDPSPTLADVDTLRDGVARTQVVRHARQEAALPVEARHVGALVRLNADAALRCALERSEDADEYEERVTLADAVERARARAYLYSLSIAEWERRAEVDYEEEYLEIDNGDSYNMPRECPVCGLEALIERVRDSYVDEFAAGSCAACSYLKAFDVADLEGRDEAIRRAVRDPRR